MQRQKRRDAPGLRGADGELPLREQIENWLEFPQGAFSESHGDGGRGLDDQPAGQLGQGIEAHPIGVVDGHGHLLDARKRDAPYELVTMVLGDRAKRSIKDISSVLSAARRDHPEQGRGTYEQQTSADHKRQPLRRKQRRRPLPKAEGCAQSTEEPQQGVDTVAFADKLDLM